MLRKLSRSGFLIQLILILALLALQVFLPAVPFGHLQINLHAAPLAGFIAGLLPEDAFYLSMLNAAAILLVIILYNILLSRHELVPKQSIFIGFILALLMLYTLDGPALFIALIVLLLLLFSLNSIMGMYSEHDPYVGVLNAAAAISLASMIVPQAIVFALFIWLGFFTLRISSWREWMISLLGLIAPYFYLAFFYFWKGSFGDVIEDYRLFFESFRITFSRLSIFQNATLVLLALLLFVSAVQYLSDAGEKLISIRKKMWLNAQFQWAGLAMLALMGTNALIALPLIYLPLSLMVSNGITQSRRAWFYDLAVLLLLILIVISRMGF